ncbi:MAG TPA: hypothetical protein VN851_12910 [Thermoanaerobaculia bacterium]|nr:hypothetical protein [Thermoanaerobaculia bacterium]
MSESLRATGFYQDAVQFEEDCRDLGMLVAAAETKRLIYGLDKDLKAEQLSELAHCIIKVLESELSTNHFLKLRAGYADLMLPMAHFGEVVALVFPGAASDIAEASACLALERYQGCVFHSMLVLEHGLKWICAELAIPFPPYDQWLEIIKDIEKAIGKIEAPKTDVPGRERRELLAGAASHFRMVKDGWRNHVTHGRASYGSDASEAIYRSVRQIMIDLAEYEEKKP